MSRTYDVVIVGGGLVGAALACALANQLNDISIALVDVADEPAQFSGDQFDPRVVALSPGSQRFLSEAGVWGLIERQRLCPYQKMQVWDGEGQGEIAFDAADVHQQHLGHIVENSVAVRACLQRLATLPSVTILRGDALTSITLSEDIEHAPHGLTLANGETLSTHLVIGADGARSPVRSMAGILTREWDYEHTAIVTTIQTTLPHQQTAWQRFTHNGPLAYLPLPSIEGAHYCSIVWSLVPDEAETLLAMSDNDFCAKVGKAMEHRLGDITGCAARVGIPLRQRHAVDYIKPGIVLVGDAAHSIHPLAGQGVNLGLKDVAVLVAECVRARSRDIALYDWSVLRRYQRQRVGENKGAMMAMEGFKRLFGDARPAALMLRNTGLKVANKSDWLKRLFIQTAIS